MLNPAFAELGYGLGCEHFQGEAAVCVARTPGPIQGSAEVSRLYPSICLPFDRRKARSGTGGSIERLDEPISRASI